MSGRMIVRANHRLPWRMVHPPIEKLCALVSYDPETGFIWWKDGTRWAGERACATPHHANTLRGCISGHYILAHRLAWALHYGEWPRGEIDHINHDRSDNRLVNLRVVGRTENLRNCSMRSDNTSGVTGVRRHGTGWQASIRVDKKTISLGSFGSLAEATEARRAANIKYGFHPNHGQDGALSLGAQLQPDRSPAIPPSSGSAAFHNTPDSVEA